MILVQRIGTVGHQRRVARAVLRNEVSVHFPFRLQPALGLIDLAVRRQGPDEPAILRPIRRDDGLEYPPFPIRIEMCRLAAVAADVETIVGADRHVDLFGGISVEVAEVERVRAIGVLLPAVKGRTDVLTPRIGLRVGRCVARCREHEHA